MLANAIGLPFCYNCKSGKDRTGWMHSENCAAAIARHQGLPLTALGGKPSQPARQLLQVVLENDGNAEVQKYNTGAAGNKVAKTFGPLGSVLGLNHRVGKPALFKVQGLSKLV